MGIEYNRSDQTVGCADRNTNIHHMISVSAKKKKVCIINKYISC